MAYDDTITIVNDAKKAAATAKANITNLNKIKEVVKAKDIKMFTDNVNIVIKDLLKDFEKANVQKPKTPQKTYIICKKINGIISK